MRWVVVAIVGVFVVLMAVAVLTSLRLERQARLRTSAGPSYSGTGPEYEKLSRALTKGAAGYAELQALMKSPDTNVATNAAQALLDARNKGAYELFFTQVQSLPPANKDALRYASFDFHSYNEAAKRVRDRDPKTSEGAWLFLNLSYARNSAGAGDAAFQTLVSAVPSANEKDSGRLAYTIGLFRPASALPLIKLLKDPSPRVRRTAARALGAMQREDALDDVVRLAKTDPDATVSKAAAAAESAIRASLTAASPLAASGPSADPDQADRLKKRLGMP